MEAAWSITDLPPAAPGILLLQLLVDIASAPTVCPAKMDGNHPKETMDKDNEEVIDVDQNEEAVGNRWNVHIS